MNYKLGDFVRFVEEDFEGHITKIINDELVAVTGEDGFEIPVQASKITKVYGQQNREDIAFDEKDKKPVVQAGPFVTEGIYLAITGDQKQNTGFFHLVNETSYDLLVSFNTEKAKQVVGEYAGILRPRSTQKIYTVKISEISGWPLFAFQFLFHAAQLQPPKGPLEIARRIKPFDLSDSKKHVPLLNERAWLFRLDEDGTKIDAAKLKESFFSHRPDKK
ncbi:hypothetical protein H8S90_04935 [Olivibacter sp. SDN3]|uniref:hypothetical protein n=1 Tax=Olivibacter sp. SDN3 TaxID=2764720 RepID=UPI00165197B0|nr:hypothetical protein [Olivibacter sp. SDN3]QNL50938.1 hypothetical protein H8S90_04935 [Olivibacter sp. SDN3]